MNTLTVRRQLMMAFGALTVLVLFVSLWGLRNLGASNERFSSYIHGPAEREGMASEVRILANRRAIGVRDMVLSSTEAERESAKAMAVKGHADLQDRLKALRDDVGNAADATERDRAMVNNIAEISQVLFRDLLLPFEVTSILILVAILGAVVLARKEQ